MRKYLCMIVLSAALASCGDFFTFEEEPDEWTGVTMTATCDGACVMVGDTMPLTVKFEPRNPNDSPVFWMLNDTTGCARVVNDSLVAVSVGDPEVIAVGGSGRVSDTCKVSVIDRWDIKDFERMHPSDMVIYADVTLDGKQWDDKTQILGAFVRGTLAGVGVKREAYGITYTVLRIWALADQDVGTVTLRLYDRAAFRLHLAAESPEFDAYKTLGTLSALYPITFTSKSK